MKKVEWKTVPATLRAWCREDPEQSRALGNVVKFFLFLLLCTLIARGTSGAAMARVALCRPSQQTMVRSLYASGTVEALGQTQIPVAEGLTVSQVLAAPGEAVTQGQPLAAFDPEALEITVAQKTARRQQLQVQLETLREAQPVSDRQVVAAKRMLERAETERDTREEALKSVEADLEAAREILALVGKEPAGDTEASARVERLVPPPGGSPLL